MSTDLIDVAVEFATDEACLDYLERIRWPVGVTCPKCQLERISRVESTPNKNSTRVRRLYECLNRECGHQFTATAGTIFHDSHLPLTKWFIAAALMSDSNRVISAKQVQRHLKLGSYRTAWYLWHRIREAMQGGL